MGKQNNETMKICIMGASTTTNNRGVSALAVSLVKILLNVYSDAQIRFLIGNRDSLPQKIATINGEISVPTINYRQSPKAPINQQIAVIILASIIQWFIPSKKLKFKLLKLFPVLKTIYTSDIIGDIQGGDSFSDIYGLKNFILGIIPMIITLLLGKRLVLLPQTYGPYKSVLSKILAGFIIKRAHIIYSRDRSSISEISKLFKRTQGVVFCPDVAFMLDPIKIDSYDVHPILESKDKPLIGFNINGLMYNGGYTRSNMFNLAINYKSLVLEITEALLLQNARILLIPHTYGKKGNVNSDPAACEEVLGKIDSDSIHILRGEYNQSELKYIISLCDFFAGSRMHSCIAALSQKIPTVGLAYSKKFIGVFDSIGAGDCVIDCREMDSRNIIDSVLNKYKKRNTIKSKLSDSIEIVKNSILDTFKKHSN